MTLGNEAVMESSSARRESKVVDSSRYLVPVGRLLFVAIFLFSVPLHFSGAGVAYATQQGVPFANVLVPISGVLALLGGLSVLFGYHARVGAVLLALFLVPVTLMMHNFWVVADPMQRQVQQIMFAKNVSMLGTTLVLMYFGAGPVSLDARFPASKRFG